MRILCTLHPVIAPPASLQDALLSGPMKDPAMHSCMSFDSSIARPDDAGQHNAPNAMLLYVKRLGLVADAFHQIRKVT